MGRGSCGSLQESTSRVWGLARHFGYIKVFFFVLAGTHSFRVNTFLIEICVCDFLFFSSSERPSFFKI